jgi:hypothetical protein
MKNIIIDFKPKEDYEQIIIGGYKKACNISEVKNIIQEFKYEDSVSGIYYQFGENPTLFHKMEKSNHVWKLITNNPKHEVTVYILEPNNNNLSILKINIDAPSTGIILPNHWIAGIASHPDCEILCAVSPKFDEHDFSLMYKNVFDKLNINFNEKTNKEEIYKFVNNRQPNL